MKNHFELFLEEIKDNPTSDIIKFYHHICDNFHMPASPGSGEYYMKQSADEMNRRLTGIYNTIIELQTQLMYRGAYESENNDLKETFLTLTELVGYPRDIYDSDDILYDD